MNILTVVAWLGLLAGGASMLDGLLGLGGALSPWLDIANNLAPILATAGLLALLAAPLRRATRLAGLAMGLTGLLLAAWRMAPEWRRPEPPAAAATAPGQIKVIQFNAWERNPQLPQAVDWLMAQHPDVVVLEETGPLLRDLILARTGWRGVMGYSTTTMIITPPPYLEMNRPQVDPASKLTFVNATYASASGRYDVVGVHLDWPGPRQARQRAALRQVLAALPRERTILAGDFNSTPWSLALRADDRGFGLIRRDRAAWSWPAAIVRPWRSPWPFPFMPLDHVYAGPGWATVSVTRGPRLGSDHYPLVVILAPVATRSGG